MTLNLKLIAVLLGVSLVAACDGGGGDDGNDATGIASFGKAFVAMFNANPNDDPVDAQTINIMVDATADPFNP